MSSIELNLDYVNARRLLLPQVQHLALVQVGCGGTGSWLAASVARIARLLVEKFHMDVSVAFIDPDTVEAKNCFRQNFCEAEIGQFKAQTLAYRCGLAWGVEICAFPNEFKSYYLEPEELTVVIGCVDNAAARQSIRQAVGTRGVGDGRIWWLDCGNSRDSGQVLLGCGSMKPKNPFELPGFCSWLPMPTTRHPELLEAQPEELRPEGNLSCADLALLDSQGMAINQRIAAEATDYLVRMLLMRDLRKWGTYIDLASGTTRSKYIVQENAVPERG